MSFRSLFCKHTYSMEGLFTSPEAEQAGYAVLVMICVKCDKMRTFRVLLNSAKVAEIDGDGK